MDSIQIQKIEEYLQRAIFPELEEGRPGWDKPHTIAVVYYLKEIVTHTPDLLVDFPVLLIAAYTHDWGYTGLFHKGNPLNLDTIISAKILHMQIGVEKVTHLLQHSFFSFLKTEQKQRVIHLVGVHDKLSEIKDTDERILVEADTLGGLDTDRITPFADQESSDRYIQGVEKKRIPLFISDYAIKKVRELIQKRKQYYI